MERGAVPRSVATSRKRVLKREKLNIVFRVTGWQWLTKRYSAAAITYIHNARGEVMTWEIVTGIIALVGFVVTIATYSSKQSSVLAKLEATLNALNETLEELKENNRASHKDIYNKLSDHDKRISKLEVYHDK